MASLSEVLAQEVADLEEYLSRGQERLKSLKVIQSTLNSSYSESRHVEIEREESESPFVEYYENGQRFVTTKRQFKLWTHAKMLQFEEPGLSFSDAVMKALRGY